MPRTHLGKRLIAITAALATWLDAGTGWSQTAGNRLEGCYARNYPKGAVAEDYSSIRIGIRPPAAGTRGAVMLSFQHGSLPHASFGYDELTEPHTCKFEAGKIRCGIECDGGHIELRPLINGDLLVAGGIRIEEARLSSLLLAGGSNFSFGGTHVLRRAPAEMCRAADTTANDTRVLFQPGDFHTAVTEVSVQLAKLGFLSAPPSPLYAQETAAAMRTFQASMGLPPTGNADARSVRILNITAVTSGGC